MRQGNGLSNVGGLGSQAQGCPQDFSLGLREDVHTSKMSRYLQTESPE